MGVLESFRRAELERIANLRVEETRANLKADEEIYKIRLEHELSMKRIKIVSLKKRLKELKEMRAILEDLIHLLE